MAPVATKQFKLKVQPELWEQLDSAAKKYGKDSANMVAVEIVKRYFPLWMEIAEDSQRLFEKQCENARLGHTSSKSTPVLRFETPAKKPTIKAKSKRSKLSG